MESSLTPMMQQFFNLKKANPEFLLFFRLGDFYEMFDEDARLGSKILGLTLTKRQEFDMCGIPHHAKDNYLHKLIEANVKVALCEQIEISVAGKRSFDRRITEYITPGTFYGDSAPHQKENSFLMSLTLSDSLYHFSLVDVNTGEIFLGHSPTKEHIATLIYHRSPAEIIIPQTQKEKLLPLIENTYYSSLSPSFFSCPDEDFLRSQFHTLSLSSVGLDSDSSKGVIFASLQYIRNNLFKEIIHLDSIKKLLPYDTLWMSDTTIQNLDILPPNTKEQGTKHSLYEHLNQTKTLVGARYLREQIVAPSLSLPFIQNRLDQVEIFSHHLNELKVVRGILATLPDFPRLIAKVSLKTANPKDLWALKRGLDQIDSLIASMDKKIFREWISEPIHSRLQAMNKAMTYALVPDPPTVIDGDAVFREEYSPLLTELRQNSTQNYSALMDIEERERNEHKLPHLRIKYNKILGYYIELPKTEARKAPSHFIRKQTLSNLERFTIEDLLHFESVVLSSKATLIEKEKELFENFCEEMMGWLLEIQSLVNAIKELDLVTTFAHISSSSHYVRPQITLEGSLEIDQGRHPVVEKFTSIFTPNSVTLDDQDNRLWIISGPNMAGKSTFLRQCAIIVLMAHLGCFVPAAMVKIPITDQIFTRIGSSDNLAKGESTFLVEMAEASAMLNFSTHRSLIIMDELGRGTSTNDGLALCWSIIEYLCDPQISHGKILFSTHYHELASLEKEVKGVRNYQMSVQEHDDQIIFLHKIEHGAATQSYGIHVASLAGIPTRIIERAKTILESLDKKDTHLSTPSLFSDLPPQTPKKKNDSVLINELRNLSLESMTGIDALVFLQRWQGNLKKPSSHRNQKEEEMNIF